ncbi:CLUMA_CG005236, isoform A [Clunio marinus]|uniref:CLUMA_CG005236, isoform A n=1 Tax=Clunio marinus TaxID=568069 RepID=A0A1J1HYG9_9DIPT|nr:CLUMA_CG005236, isoform A [Clunio marinus]
MRKISSLKSIGQWSFSSALNFAQAICDNTKHEQKQHKNIEHASLTNTWMKVLRLGSTNSEKLKTFAIPSRGGIVE